MNANAKKWVKALKSGKYKRAKGWLRRTDEKGAASYCCLGLACELYRQATGDGEWTKDNLFKSGRTKEEAGLPRRVRKWLGLKDKVDDGLVGLPHKHRFSSLAHVNDAKGGGLKRAAAVIEKQQQFLFEED